MKIFLQLNSKNPINHGNIEPVQLIFRVKLREWVYQKHTKDSSMMLFIVEIQHSLRIGRKLNCHGSGFNQSLMHLKKTLFPLHEYQSGSNGPKASDLLLEENGFKWWLDEMEK